MSTKDDEDWARILAGGDVKDADPEVRRLALALRDSLSRRMESLPVESSEEEWMASLHKKIGVVDETRAPGILERVASWLGSFSMPQVAVAALLVLSIGVGVRVALQDTDTLPPAVIRDFPAGERVFVEVDDPAAQQASLAKDLSAAGITVRMLTADDGTLIVQATLPEPVGDKLAGTLTRYGLKHFPGGDLDVGFRPRK